MTFDKFLITYMQQSKMNINDFSKLIGYSVNMVENWCKNINLPMFKDRCNILLNLHKTMSNSSTINIKDNDGFTFELSPKMSNKYQTEKGRQKYYESSRWDKLKQKVFERADYKCEICGCKGSGENQTTGLNIHHMLYASDFGTGKENLDELLCVCNLHHSMLHAADNEKKADNYEGRSDGKYKALIIEKADGSKDVKLFDDEVTDKQINAWVAKIQHKFHFKYKNWYIKGF